MQDSYERIGQYSIRVRTFSSNSPTTLLLIHGLGVSGDYFLPYATLMANTAKVLVLDLPGYGKTKKPKQALSIQELANVVTDYVKIHSLQNVIIVGHSMGAQIVIEAVASAPSYFEKVLLLSPTCNVYERTLPVQMLRLTLDAFVESPYGNLVVLKNYVRMGPARYARSVQYMLGHHLEKTIQNVRVPVTVVSGTRDGIAPHAWIQLLAEQAPLGRAIQVKGAPHLIQLKKKEELAAITRRFIEE